ncbi:Ig-like domain-containing protein [Wukongibacter baidiensis]|uniref:Ig-like domain-containing protein n=1 Tax=Wukongibacter baidiensis TaxID=1723361 RepID=UPI003D7F4F96
MKIGLKSNFFFVVVLLIFSISSVIAFGEGDQPVEEDWRLKFNEWEFTIKAGDQDEIKIWKIYEDGREEDITSDVKWTAENSSIVSVENGVIKGLSEGETIVWMEYDDMKEDIFVVVCEEEWRLEFSQWEFKIKKDEITEAKIWKIYEDGREENITHEVEWTVENNEIVSVENGVIKGLNEGETKIWVKYGDMKEDLFVWVCEEEWWFEFSEWEFKLEKGETREITVWKKYEDGRKEDISNDVKWTVENNDIASIENGVISGLNEGETKIWLEYEYRDEDLFVWVCEEYEEEWWIEFSGWQFEIEEGHEVEVQVWKKYGDGRKEEITHNAKWTTDNDEIVSVENGVIEGLYEGETIVWMEYEGKKEDIRVWVYKEHEEEWWLEFSDWKFEVQEGELAEVKLWKIYADGREEDITHEAKWIVENDDVVSVEDGIIKGLHKGESKVWMEYEGREDDIYVYVIGENQENWIELSDYDIEIDGDESVNVKAWLVYENGIKEDITAMAEWTSENTDIAEVSNGRITGLAKGYAQMLIRYEVYEAYINVYVGDYEDFWKIELSQWDVELEVDSEIDVEAFRISDDGDEIEISNEAEWIPENPEIVSVIDGRIVGLKQGYSGVVVKYEEKEVYLIVNVIANTDSDEDYVLFNDSNNIREVTSDKEWTIKFNDVIDESSVDGNIFIRKENEDSLFPIQLEISEDGKAIEVKHEELFEAGKVYYLYINREIRSLNNDKSLNSGIKMIFRIEE